MEGKSSVINNTGTTWQYYSLTEWTYESCCDKGH